MSQAQRRLSAIMFTDMVGFTALTQSDEAQSLAVLERHNRILRPIFLKYNGREVKAIGDSFLVEFDSALEAVNCAVEVQRHLHDYNVSAKDEWKIVLRVGIHLGDVVRKEGDVFGDAVNIASRIQPLAEPEGVCMSREVFDQIRNKVQYAIVKVGPRELRNVQVQVEIFRVMMPWESSAAESSALPINRIAVLPFASFSPDPQDAFFADGITDEIISTVAGISGLSVISRTSVMGYKGTTKKIQDIGNELKVGSILEGSFKKAGNKIRVTTQLIEVANDRHLWAQSYDRSMDDVFEVQGDIAKQVAEALRVRIQTSEMKRLERKPTDNTTAYELYLKGRSYWAKRGIAETKRAREYFELAVHEDPSFALGYVGQADCCVILSHNWRIDRDENQRRAKALVAKALELDPELAEAHATMGVLHENEYQTKDAEAEYTKAIQLKPNYATAHHWYFILLRSENRNEEALSEIEKAVDLDPLSAVICWNHGYYYFANKDYDTALGLFRKAMDLGPATFDLSMFAHGSIADVYGILGRYDEMDAEIEREVHLLRDAYPLIEKAGRAKAAQYRKDREMVRRLLPELEDHPETGFDSYSIADLYFFLGETDAGFRWLEKAYLERTSGFEFIWYDKDLDGVREDPRFGRILKMIGQEASTGG